MLLYNAVFGTKKRQARDVANKTHYIGGMNTKVQKDTITAQESSTNQGTKFVVSLRSSEENTRWEQENTHVCSITGETYVGYGNNAYPFPGRCSDDANRKYVIPARLLHITPEYISKWGVGVVAGAVAAKANELGWEF